MLLFTPRYNFSTHFLASNESFLFLKKIYFTESSVIYFTNLSIDCLWHGYFVTCIGSSINCLISLYYKKEVEFVFTTGIFIYRTDSLLVYRYLQSLIQLCPGSLLFILLYDLSSEQKNVSSTISINANHDEQWIVCKTIFSNDFWYFWSFN